jgi:hypothetical protein
MRKTCGRRAGLRMLERTVGGMSTCGTGRKSRRRGTPSRVGLWPYPVFMPAPVITTAGLLLTVGPLIFVAVLLLGRHRRARDVDTSRTAQSAIKQMAREHRRRSGGSIRGTGSGNDDTATYHGTMSDTGGAA